MKEQVRLNGWKSIARHFDRSERTIQLWEAERALPVHRIPGTKGWTVFAYVDEIDAWMTGADQVPGPVTDAGGDLVPLSQNAQPGLLVMPFESTSSTADPQTADCYVHELIARFAALPSLRILSWTTSRRQKECEHSAQELSQRLGVRYLVEGAVHDTTHCRRVDIRIVDAELDQILLAHRFSSSRVDETSFRTLVVHGIVDHFDLVLFGALVEPLSPNEIDPECYIHYLEGARYFAQGDSAGLRRCCLALDRALVADSGFMPARALRSLANLQAAAIGEQAPSQALATARTVLDACGYDRSARVTAAFLDAAIAIEFDADTARAERQLSRALLAMPPSVALRGRLYDRRSARRAVASRGDRTSDRTGLVGSGTEHAFAALDELLRRQPQNLFANVMRVIAGSAPRDRRSASRRSLPSGEASPGR